MMNRTRSTRCGRAIFPMIGTLALLLFQSLELFATEPPPADLNLRLAAPIQTWDEAVPLGNGLMGGLLWGEGNVIRLSLDRGDLWDERPNGEPGWWTNRTYAKAVELIAKKDFGTVNRWWDEPYNGVTPTKLPGGRLEIALSATSRVESFELNLATAEGWAHLGGGRKVEVFFSATEPVALVRIPAGEDVHLSLLPAGAKREAGNAGPSSGGAVAKLGYPPARQRADDELVWFEQPSTERFAYAVAVAMRRTETGTILAIAMATRNEGKSPQAVAAARARKALATGFESARKPHLAWWKAFWAQSSVSLPAEDFAIAQQYYVVRYLLGAGSRRGAPPMPLQGVWTADNGGLPPWKGDYHNDLNTQMTYLSYPAAGHFDEGLSYLDFLWDRRDVFAAFARDFYGTEGLACPGVMSLAGQPLGGWGMYSMSPTMSAWSAHLFYLHWRYTMDDAFLRERAWPWCRGVGLCMKGLLRTNEQGVLVLPLSSSPEIFDNSGRAWLKPNSNYDLMCLRMLFLALTEMADAQGLAAEAAGWKTLAERLGPYHLREDGTLKINAVENLPGSHRHLSNLMGVHPFNLITMDEPSPDRRVITLTLAEWDKFGPGAWCGYSYSWMATLRARVGDAEKALRLLDVYAKAFVLRNGFHVNGDQTKSGFSGFTYRPFTLEGNFLAMQAVQEMLLQSWSPTPGVRDTEAIRIFPATPWRWHDVAFTDLRVEGGHKVSAVRKNNATQWFRVVAGRAGTVRIRDNFGGASIVWNRTDVRKDGSDFVFAAKRGETIEATLAIPRAVPAAPANVAEPVVIRKPSAIRSSGLPLRVGADSAGGSRFKGDIARAVVFGRVLDASELARLADPSFAGWGELPGVIVVPERDGRARREGGAGVVLAEGGLSGSTIHLDGTGWVELPHDKAYASLQGLTLAAWVRPAASEPGGMRILDTSRVGAADGFLLDTYPNLSLRLITRDPHLVFDAQLPLGQWSHVAATVDGASGRQALYVNGRMVAAR